LPQLLLHTFSLNKQIMKLSLQGEKEYELKKTNFV